MCNLCSEQLVFWSVQFGVECWSFVLSLVSSAFSISCDVTLHISMSWCLVFSCFARVREVPTETPHDDSVY